MATILPTTEPATSSDVSPVTAKLPAAALGMTGVVVSFLFTYHGLVGLFGTFGGGDGQGGTVELLSWLGWWGSVIHLVAGALVLAACSPGRPRCCARARWPRAWTDAAFLVRGTAGPGPIS